MLLVYAVRSAFWGRVAATAFDAIHLAVTLMSDVLQDECACIGCKMCVWCASGTFRIDEQHGRSRVFAQWVDHEEKIEVNACHCFKILSSKPARPLRIHCPQASCLSAQ